MSDVKPLLRAISHYGPITALKFNSHYLLAAFGCVLRVYNLDDNSLVFERQLLAKNKIHGITIDNDRVAVFGGRNVLFTDFATLLQYDPAQEVFQEKAVGDWIFSVEFSGGSALILTAHNVVLEVDLTSCAILHHHTCGEKSILYAGSIRVVEGKDPIVCAGTVMGGIQLWNMRTSELLHTLVGHEGSIFGCEISPDGARIVSCSDDRSIKIWDFETGKNIATGWGHGSRIWHLQFFDANHNYTKVFSCSEDLTVRVWTLDVAAGELACNETWDCHLGRHVWSGDVNEEKQIAASGGADGRLRLHLLKPYLSDGFSYNRESFSLAEIAEATGVEFFKKEILKQYVAMASGVLAVSSRGKFFLYNFEKWVFLFQDDKYAEFAILNCIETTDIATVTARSGDILLLKFKDGQIETRKEVQETNLEGAKIANVLSVNTDGKLVQMTDCPNPKYPYILRSIDQNLDVATTILSKPPQTFTTTLLTYDAINNWLIIGSRFVTFAVYDLNVSGTVEMADVFKRLCPGDTISAISVTESKKNAVILLVIVKDGQYLYVELTKADKFSLKILHKNILSKGFLEGSFHIGQDLFFYGFKSSHFYIWNETRQMEVFSEFCGGPKRQWRLVRTAEDAAHLHYKFIFTKADLVIRTFSIEKDTCAKLLTTGTNGREIRSVSVSPKLSGYRLMATASEDATIRLSKLTGTGAVENVWQLRAHVSGLQQVKFITDEYLMSSAAREEFFVWKITDRAGKVPLITDFAVVAPSSSNPDLRIMDFDTMPVCEGKALSGFVISTVYSDSTIKIFYFDIESKSFTLLVSDHYTTCCVWHVRFIFVKEVGRFYLLTGATDGHVAIWDITTNIIANFAYTACCKADFCLSVKELGGKVSQLGPLLVKQAIHQNGIKDLEIVSYGDKLVLVTGGDDNALGVSQISFTKGISFVTTQFLENAASSTITAVCQIDSTKLMVTSVDQYIRIWELNGDGSEVTLLDERYTTIADTGCATVTEFDGAKVGLIAGAGLSVWGL
ncbi:hypothetical protein BABINDRAFT_163021, partial [Babjeviella inositovora NRRL Y-12698]